MKLDAIVKKDGTLIAKAPKSLRGKKIKIILEEKEKNKSISAWNEIANILNQADTLDIPQRNIKEIIDTVKFFRES